MHPYGILLVAGIVLRPCESRETAKGTGLLSAVYQGLRMMGSQSAFKRMVFCEHLGRLRSHLI